MAGLSVAPGIVHAKDTPTGTLRERLRQRLQDRRQTFQRPGNYEFFVEYQGRKRKFYVHVPASYERSRPMPLVLNFHGGGASAEGHRTITKMDGASEKHGFIAVYPRGTRADGNEVKRYQRFWNVGEGPQGTFNSNPIISRSDDIGFVKKILDDVSDKFNIDDTRIYATGFSNGAIFSYYLACHVSDRIAAIAPVAAPFWNYPGDCQMKRAVSVMHFHGKDDKCAPYNGGPAGCEAGIANEGRIFPSVENSINVWREIDSCSQEPKGTYSNGDATCITYSPCAEGTEITLCTMEGAGHTWPGGKPYSIPGFEIGETSYDINANDAMWEFFQKHPLTPAQKPATFQPFTPTEKYGPGDYDFSLMHDGLNRIYKVHVPVSYTGQPLPVVLAFHGGGGNAQGSVEFYGINGLADKEGFIVVYPEGTGKELNGKVFGSWNAGRCCSPASENKIDDVGFIAKMIAKLKDDFTIDERRIFAIGHSNGALISYRLACELSDQIAAIAVGGAQDSFDNCRPSRPIPLLHFHGSDDKCAPYQGGECGGCFADFLTASGIPSPRKTWECRPVPEYIDEWRQRNGCSDQTAVTFKNGNATCFTYQQCRDNADVTLCLVEGMGHTWPGRLHKTDACKKFPNSKLCQTWMETVGETSNDISANDALWEFFQKHPKK